MSKRSKDLLAHFCSPAAIAELPPDTPVLLAFSGGADSRVLLDLLAKDAADKGYTLTLAHVNHGIRGEESVQDRRFCETLAARYGLEICILDADVPTLAKQNGRGLEEEARAVRYEYFAELMRARNIPLLVTAHHADDNLETMLFRLARGTGLDGLGGIKPVRPFAGGMLVRPLLSVSRREILAYCEENPLEYVTDSTNADVRYARNRIRAEVVPILDELFEGASVRAATTAEHLREDAALLNEMAADWRARAETDGGLSLETLSRMPVPIARRVLRQCFYECTGCELEQVHIDALMKLIADRSAAAEVALPTDCIAVLEFGCLRFLKDEALAEVMSGEPLPLPFRVGETQVTEAGVCITVRELDPSLKIHNLSTESHIILYTTADIIEESFHWRVRRDGDLLLRGGMHRKLRRLYREAGISPRRRARMPLLCDADGVVWAPFVGARDGLPQEGRAYLITVKLPTVNDASQRENGHYQRNGGTT